MSIQRELVPVRPPPTEECVVQCILEGLRKPMTEKTHDELQTAEKTHDTPQKPMTTIKPMTMIP